MSDQTRPTDSHNAKERLRLMKGVSVYDGETHELLFEFIPALTMVKVVSRGKLFLIDVQQLAALHQHGHRAVQANATTKIKRLVEPIDGATNST